MTTAPSHTPETGSEPVLQFADLDVQFGTEFGSVHAVKGISLQVRPGEVLALVGESGSGKSVTSMTALGLLPSNARINGDIRVTDKFVNKLDDKSLRRMRGNDVAMVFQEPMTALNPVLTIGDQLTESLELHDIAHGTEADARAVELLRMVGIPEPERRVKQYPHEMSGGQRQRVVIALALACNPRVIIADEPTTALDVTVQAEILDLLRSLKDKLNTGILLITHNMGVVADMADRVAVMFKGDIVERGTADEVLTVLSTRTPRSCLLLSHTWVEAQPSLVCDVHPWSRSNLGSHSRSTCKTSWWNTNELAKRHSEPLMTSLSP